MSLASQRLHSQQASGISSALLTRVILYDVLEEGFHSPLMREQIADLFHAGRLHRNSPCKLAVKTEWRTVDELFPLLKHDSPYLSAPRIEGPTRISVWVPIGIRATLLLSLAIIFAVMSLRGSGPKVAAVHPAAASARQPAMNVTPVSAQPVYAISPRFGASQATSVNTAMFYPTETTPDRNKNQEAERSRLEEQRLAREQLQRDQAANAERLRAENAQREAQRQRAAGKDFIVPLDKDFWIGEPGLSAWVKVRDNDVISFDVWINGNRRREVRKEKGITGSRADETLIHSQGSLSLYYVWEISGELNHCRLRLREG